MKKQTDWKFIIGIILFIVIFGFMAGNFWKYVGKQAELVKEEEAREEAEAISAIYVYTGDLLKTGVYVDMKTHELFDVDIPAEGIYNKSGTLIKGDVPEEGDMFKIYGDNELTGEDVIKQYTGVTKMQRTGRSTLEQADAYKKIAAEALQ